jgi:hypothetical protein
MLPFLISCRLFTSPLTLGANIGTTLTGLMAAFVAEGTDSLQVALAHLFFNVFGIVVWYPIPFMRKVPIHAARQLGKATRAWRGFPILYIIILFFAVPGLLLAISTMFTTKKAAQVAVASVIVVLLFFFLAALVWWWRFRDGRFAVGAYFQKRTARMLCFETLPYDMAWSQRKIKEIQEHTNCPATEKVNAMEEKKVFANVSDDMKHVHNMINALIDHLDMEKEVDVENLGRMYHKKNEPMPEVDLSGLRGYQLTVLGIILFCLALMLWAIAALAKTGSVATKGMAGYLGAMTALFVLFRVYKWFFTDAKTESVNNYKHQQQLKLAKKRYLEVMPQMKADLDKLAKHTELTFSEVEEEAEKETAMEKQETAEEGPDEEISA